MKARTTLSLPKSTTQQTVSGLESLDLNKLDGEIWTFMSDYKKRTVQEIRHAIVLLGYPLPLVDRRLDTIFAKKWFDRNGERGNDVKYTLKKHIKHPNKEKIMQEKETEGAAPAVASRSVGTMLKGSIVATLAAVMPEVPERNLSGFAADPAVVEKMAEGALSTEGTLLKPHIGEKVKVLETPADKPHAMLSGAPVSPTASENVPDYTVNENDPVRVAIWKVMRDGQQYTLADLSTLLDHITGAALSYNLKAMADDGLFFTERKNKKSPIVYRMLSDVPMPEGFPPYIPHPKAVEAKPESKPEDKPDDAPVSADNNQQHSNEESLMSTNNNPAASPLFSMTAQIRGKDYTLQQLRAIKSDLQKSGFINSNLSSHHSSFSGEGVTAFEFMVKLGDEMFTISEIRELAEQLKFI